MTFLKTLSFFLIAACTGFAALASFTVNKESARVSMAFPSAASGKVHSVPQASTVSFDNNPGAIHDMTFASR